MSKELIILGTGGHAKVVYDAVIASGDYKPIGFIDLQSEWDGDDLPLPYLGDYSEIANYPDAHYVIAIGSNRIRQEVAEEYDLHYATIIHPSAIFGSNVTLGVGSFVSAGVIINANSIIGKHTIINTGAIIEHDNIIGRYSNIGPRATTGSTVMIGEHCLLGIHVAVLPNLTISAYNIIGAGALVTKDIHNQGIYVGIPAKAVEKEL
jgi:acetyltransferase EpsM